MLISEGVFWNLAKNGIEELQPKDILSIDLECLARFALNNTKEGEDLSLTSLRL